jgi:hypothetical protein
MSSPEFLAHAAFDHDRNKRPHSRVTALAMCSSHVLFDASAILWKLTRQSFRDGLNLRLFVVVHQRTSRQDGPA